RLLPSVTANASQNFGVNSDYERINPNNNFGISANVDIYNGGRNKLNFTQAENQIFLNKLDQEIIQNNISLQIANSYLNALLNKENIKVAQEQINITTIQLNKMQELIDAGVNPKADLFDIQATLEQNKQQLVQAENTLDLSLLNLAQLIQVSPDGFDIKEVNINLNQAVLLYDNAIPIYETALKSRPEIHKAEIAIENAELSIKSAKTNLLPSIGLNYSLNTSYAYRFPGDGAFDKIFNQYNDNHGHNIGISARYTIFDGKSNRARISKAKITRDIVSQSLAEEKLRLRETIQRAFLDTRTSLKQYEASLSSLKALQVAYKIAEERYKLGALNVFDFDLLRARLFNAKTAVLNAKYNFIFKTKVLDFYNDKPIIIE
ncbi:MAG TPA: TolC family protein, partial [Flavobacteriia bacterium]|nr:TolC family protein [Flavobacteriia bacterium]